MGLKNVFAAALCATLVAWSGLSAADQYRPGEFLGLDLATAVLSPKPLGPATQFAPVRIEARADRARPAAPAARTRAKTAKTQVAHRRADRPRGAADAGAQARQSARCAGVRYADSGLAVQVRRHLQLEVTGHLRDPARAHQRVTNR